MTPALVRRFPGAPIAVSQAARALREQITMMSKFKKFLNQSTNTTIILIRREHDKNSNTQMLVLHVQSQRHSRKNTPTHLLVPQASSSREVCR
jgi:hypothetical protein